MSCGLRLDLSLDVLEEMRFKKKHLDLIRKLTKELHFNREEVESLLLIYYKIQKQNKNGTGVTKTQLRDILHNSMDITEAELANHFFATGTSPIIPMELWVKNLSLFLRGTLEEKIKECFCVYSMLGDGKIRRDIMLSLLDNCITAQSSDDDLEDAVKDMVEILSKKMDLDRDGKISFNDYRQCCLAQPLLLEVLGQCLPSRLAVHAFLTTFTPNVGKL